MNNFTIIIPIFNESECIFILLEEIFREYKDQKPEILIVNDGSTDDFEKKERILKKKKSKNFSSL